jgi:protein SCO1/2/putative membrane protein
MLMKRLHDLRLELGDTDVRFVSITVDPVNDTPERLRQYGEIYGATDDNWWLLTGGREAIYDLIRNGFEVVAEERFGADRVPGFEFAHTAGLIHVDAEGRMLGKYESLSPEETLTLRRVLTGAIETPEEHLIKRVIIADEGVDAEGGAVGASSSDEHAGRGELPGWLARMPLVNAMLNSLATLLLIAGYVTIKRQAKDLHRNLMLAAFGVSIAFLGCYLTYHFGRHHYLGSASATFPGTGTIRNIYLTILVTHIILAAVVPFLALTTIVLGFRKSWPAHRRWANLTFPIWLYVSVTGVVIYGMNAAHGAYDA